MGGHVGRKISKSALRGSQLTQEEFIRAILYTYGGTPRNSAGEHVPTGIKRLNQRAVATYYEIIFRQRGAHGFLASQWLYKSWKKYEKERPYSGGEELHALAGNRRQIGAVKFEDGASGNIENILFTGMIHGTAEQMQKHSILPKVSTARIAALANAIKQHHQKVARQYKLN